MISSRYFCDTAYVSCNHVGESLCGDHVEITSPDENTRVVVLADGLGSGVKADILSTLTAKMLSTLVANDVPLKECVKSIVETLPVCKERNVAYSTFTIVKIENNDYAVIYNYDNPLPFLIRNGKVVNIEYSLVAIDGKNIARAKIPLECGDAIMCMSDGCVYAGVGESLNFGWQMPNIQEYMQENYDENMSAKALATWLINKCDELYDGKFGDDTTACCIKIRERQQINYVIGPASNKDDDNEMMSLFFAKKGEHIVSGGTTSSVVARYLNKEIELPLDYMDREIPPTSKIEGVDLVTEGVVTLNRVIQYVDDALNRNSSYIYWRFGKDGASMLTRELVEKATDINFYVGCAINPAHQGENFSLNFSLKMKIVDDLIDKLKKLGKNVKVSYF